jgi:hypothetical protein
VSKKIQSGTIDQNGNLTMYMGEINDFFKKHKGSKIIAEFTVLRKEASEAIKGYYFMAIVPEFRKAIWQSGERKTEKQTDLFLREISPIMHEEFIDTKTGKYEARIKEINELSNPELVEHIEHLKQIAAEQYGLFIEDPKQY